MSDPTDAAAQPAALDAAALDRLFRTARTYRAWQPGALAPETLRALWDLACLGPTSANSSPARIVFVVSPAAKEKLKPCLDAGNVKKTMSAPATAIIGHDLRFFDHFDYLAPGRDLASAFAANDALAAEDAFRNGTLQGAYLMLAARALGLDCGPMSGFDNAAVDRAFFPGTSVRSNFLCNLGIGDGSGLRPRAPRLAFEAACRID